MPAERSGPRCSTKLADDEGQKALERRSVPGDMPRKHRPEAVVGGLAGSHRGQPRRCSKAAVQPLVLVVAAGGYSPPSQLQIPSACELVDLHLTVSDAITINSALPP